MWWQPPAMLAHTDRLHRDVFQPTAIGWEPPIDVPETETGRSQTSGADPSRRPSVSLITSVGWENRGAGVSLFVIQVAVRPP
jgi:hypothetical protein